MFVIVATALHVSSIIINDSMAFQTITKKILANNYVEFQRMCDEQKKAMNRTNIAMALAMNLSSKEDFVEYRWKEVLHNKAIAVQHIADRAEIEGKTINNFAASFSWTIQASRTNSLHRCSSVHVSRVPFLSKQFWLTFKLFKASEPIFLPVGLDRFPLSQSAGLPEGRSTPSPARRTSDQTW